ncbi:MAG: phosphonopyruvate decarboxylase [Firmicutes bacterium]|nr:phosphonopyruvate decarboxylase [Bacillota bacterium]
MLDTKTFGTALKENGFTFFSGVPCSFLKDLINYAINHCEYIIANNEGDAVATCAGAYLGGKKTVFLCQNSGLTNAISPLTSLNKPFQIPLLGFVSLRGEPGLPDEPQHELMGEITTPLLDLMRIKWDFLAAEPEQALLQLQKANSLIENGESFFFVVKKGIFSEEKLTDQSSKISSNRLLVEKTKADSLPSREAVLRYINNAKDRDTLILATTGKTGRELYEIEDAPNNFYMVGSMGCVSPLALGLALARKDKKVIAIDGDGAILMRLGVITTNAYYSPPNMLHLIIDNNSYDSTGGQLTVSHNVDFIRLAAAAGYTEVYYIHDLEELKQRIEHWKKNRGLTLLYLKIAKGSKENLGRPKIKPYQVKERIIRFINENGESKW